MSLSRHGGRDGGDGDGDGGDERQPIDAIDTTRSLDGRRPSFGVVTRIHIVCTNFAQ